MSLRCNPRPRVFSRASSGAGLPEMVKIDAEGFDLKVLAGASDLLGKTDIFLVELGRPSRPWCL